MANDQDRTVLRVERGVDLLLPALGPYFVCTAPRSLGDGAYAAQDRQPSRSEMKDSRQRCPRKYSETVSMSVQTS